MRLSVCLLIAGAAHAQPLQLEPGVALLLQGDVAPEDGYFISIAADAHRAGDLAALREELKQCGLARDQAREQHTTQFGALTKHLNVCESAKIRCDARLHETQMALDRCNATTPNLPLEPSIPAWGWALAGGGAPLAGLGACQLLDCTAQEAWVAATTSLLATLALAYFVE